MEKYINDAYFYKKMLDNKKLIYMTLILILLSAFMVIYDNRSFITGRSTSDSGNVSIELSSETAIRVFYNINFGNGRVNSTADNAVLDSDLGGTSKNGTWSYAKQYFRIENDGTVNISVNVSSDKDASSYIGGTSPAFQVKGIATEVNACPADLNITYIDILTAPRKICPRLKFGSGENEFNVSSKLVIPSDAAPGQKVCTLTFSASLA